MFVSLTICLSSCLSVCPLVCMFEFLYVFYVCMSLPFYGSRYVFNVFYLGTYTCLPVILEIYFVNCYFFGKGSNYCKSYLQKVRPSGIKNASNTWLKSGCENYEIEPFLGEYHLKMIQIRVCFQKKTVAAVT